MGVSNSKGFMFDRIKIQQNGNFLNLNLNHLDNCNEKVSKNGNHYYEGYLKGLKVAFGSGQLSINGSWPKFKYGENITELNLSTTGEVIKEINDLLSVDISNFYITQLEFGTNIFTDFTPKEYLLRLGNSKKLQRSQIFGETITYTNTNEQRYREIRFYNKVSESLKHNQLPNKHRYSNILRYELFWRGHLKQQLKTGIAVTPELLINPKFFKSMIDRLKQEYNSIDKANYVVEELKTPSEGVDAVFKLLISTAGIDEYNKAVKIVEGQSNFNKKQMERFRAKIKSYTTGKGYNVDKYIQELDNKINSL